MQPDGIGSQLRFLDLVLTRVAPNKNVSVLFDLRQSEYFQGWPHTFRQKQLNEIFSFQWDSSEKDNYSKLIFDTSEIDHIISSQPERVGAVLFYPEARVNKLKEKNIHLIDYESLPRKQILSSLLPKVLKPGPRLAELLLQQKWKTHNRIGIHARLGNGAPWDPQRAQLRPLEPEDFFKVLDRYPKEKHFFVCTDTPSFLDKCQQRYPDRIYFSERYYFPESYGPGHCVLWNLPTEARSLLQAKRLELGPYQLILDATVDMFLLSYCSYVVCNPSGFSYYATHGKSVPFTQVGPFPK